MIPFLDIKAVTGFSTGTTNVVAAVTMALVVSLLLITRFITLRKTKASPSSSSSTSAPPQIPSFIPFIGSAIELSMLGFGKMAQKYSAKFDDSPIVTALVAGRTFHLIADPAAVSAIFRYGEEFLSMGPAIRDFSKSFFGMSHQGLSTFEKGVRKHNMRFVSKHLLSTTGLERVIQKTQEVLNRQLASIIQDDQQQQIIRSSDGCQKFDLYTLVKKVMFAATLESIIFSSCNESTFASNNDFQDFDDFVEAYLLFDDAIEVAFTGLPIRLFARKSFHAREKLIRFFQSDSYVPSQFIKERIDKMQAAGMSQDDIARDCLVWVWGACTNFITSQFWMVYYIASSQDAQVAAQKEIDKILTQRQQESSCSLRDGEFSMAELDDMAVLGSAFQEMTRITMTNIIMREVMQDFEIDLRLKQKQQNTTTGHGKYFMKKGTNIVFYPPVLHHDKYLFEDPHVYQWDRFLLPQKKDHDNDKNNTNDPKKESLFVSKKGDVISEPLRTFGGGAHYCPGRKYAQQAAKSFVAMLLRKYKLSLSGTAEVSKSRDGFGFLHPKNRVDIILKRQH